MFLSLDYEFIGVSIGFSPKQFIKNRDDKLKGESSFTNYQFRFFVGNWVQGLQYKKTQGYYIENSQDFIENWQEGIDPYFQIPDLKNVTWGMSTAYVFNPKFSFRNITYQTEWQKKSAGSFVPTLNYNYNLISFQLNDSKNIEAIFRINLALAYHYTLAIDKNWFISPSLSPSLGINFLKNKFTENNSSSVENNTHFTRYIEGGVQLGYSSSRFIFGGKFNFNTNWYNEDNHSTVENNQLYGLIYIEYRFDAPKLMKKEFYN